MVVVDARSEEDAAAAGPLPAPLVVALPAVDVADAPESESVQTALAGVRKAARRGARVIVADQTGAASRPKWRRSDATVVSAFLAETGAAPRSDVLRGGPRGPSSFLDSDGLRSKASKSRPARVSKAPKLRRDVPERAVESPRRRAVPPAQAAATRSSSSCRAARSTRTTAERKSCPRVLALLSPSRR